MRQETVFTPKTKEIVLRSLEHCDRVWTKKFTPLRIMLSARWGKPLSVSEARQLSEYAPANFSAQMAAGKILLFGSEHRLSVVVDAEKCFRRALEISPHSAEAMTYVAFSLDSQGRWTEAKAVYERALELDPANELAINRHAIALEELNQIEIEGGKSKTKSPTFSRFPETIVSLSDLERAIVDNVLNHMPRDAISLTKDSRVVTVGSCFAANLALALKEEGIIATNLTVGEIINSTYANLEFFQWALGASSFISEEMSRVNRDSIRSFLESADVIIYTLGVAPCFFDKSTGKFVLPQKTEGVRGVMKGKYIFRNTTVEENYNNLKSMVALIRQSNPKSDFVFSLSPVPLTSTLEPRSSMEADCLSKAILRVAVEQIVSSTPRCVYWPSFEIVRWLGAYVPNMYGEEDGTTSHISERVIRLIMGLFLRTYMRSTQSDRGANRAR